MKFANKEELILQAKKDYACDKGIEFAESCKDLQEILETIDIYMLIWCLKQGYEQFADHCDWSKLNGYNWRRLLISKPQYSDRCDWSAFDGYNLSWLLRYQPQFSDRCDWSKLDGGAWSRLLISQPQFADRCDWSKLSGDDLDFLLKNQPQFEAYRK